MISATPMRKFFSSLIILLLFSFTAPPTLVRRTILDGKANILLPSDFLIMPEEAILKKYPKDRRPTLVYTDPTGGVNVAFNHTATKLAQKDIEAYRQSFVKTFKQLYPQAEWKLSGVKSVNDRNVGFVEVITPATDTRIYNLIFFTDMEGRLLMCTFNCVEAIHKDWVLPAQKIMNSLWVK
jgi:hypothetical protein